MTNSREVHIEALERISNAFHLGARFPGRVFKKDLGDTLFCEYEAAVSDELWPAFVELAQWHGDTQIDVVGVTSHYDDHFKHFGMFPSFAISTNATTEQFWNLIGNGAGGEFLSGSISVAINSISFTGPSEKWGCWGERDSGVAAFRGFPSPTSRNGWATRYDPMLPVSQALRSYIAQNFKGSVVPDEYAAEMTANYRNSDCP